MCISSFYLVLKSLDYDLEDLILNLFFLNLRILHVSPDEKPSKLKQSEVILMLFSFYKDFMYKITSLLFILNFLIIMANYHQQLIHKLDASLGFS